ncbi:hypothetical protein GCM10023340_04100 [Nocardioides marinquilinus]|uniref:Membrane protein involved in the export of O-antigen and teichoic acid n=1 Tax=Nocardioides marinquilinus TaxID=1210400 RepID=A0ABP9P6X8_9ACTN
MVAQHSHRAPSSSLSDSARWFAGSYAVAILGYLGVIAAAGRLLGPADLGAFLVVVTATGLVGQAGLVGVHRSGLREVARLGPDDRDELARLRDGATAVNVIVLPAASLLTAVVCWLLRGARATWPELLLAALAGSLVHLSAQQKLCGACLRGFGHTRLAALIEGRSGGALVAALQAVLVLAVWVAAPGWGLTGALAAVALGYLLPLPLAYAVLRRRWGRMRVSRTLVADLRGVVRRDWRFAVSQAGGFANASIDLWLCAALLGVTASSHFGAAQRLAQLVLLPSAALGTVVSPAVARLSARHDPQRLESLVRTVTTLALVGSVLLALPLVVLPHQVLRLVTGPGFATAAAVLVLLTLGYVANAVSGLSGITLSMTHHEGSAAAVQWGGVVLRAAVCTVSAWAWGVVGLAAASAASTLVVYAAMWAQARRHLGVLTHVTLRPRPGLLARTAA